MEFFINAAAHLLNTGMASISPALDCNHHLKNYSPTAIAGITTVSFALLQKAYTSTLPRWNESRLAQCARLLMHVPYIKEKYNADIEREYLRSRTATLEKWEVFGKPFTRIPETGLSTKELKHLIDKYHKITVKGVENVQISGAIYSNNYLKKEKWDLFEDKDEVDNLKNAGLDSTAMAHKLKWLHTYAEHMSNLWNSLHQDEFAVGDFIKYQVVRMVANMFGGKANEVMGFVTTGGTDSLMTAGRIYRNWGMEVHGHQPGEGVIIAPKSVHAAIIKSGLSSLCKVVLIDVDEQGKVNLKKFKNAMEKHKKHLTFVIGSAPSYATGIADPIKEIANLAHAYGVGMHVDCCLGGFIINNLENHSTDYLKLKGVTSLSCDTHKNGLSPKGSSVLVVKGLGSKDVPENWNLARSAIYPIPEWDGGVYGTPNDAGSEPCSHALKALISMLAMGKQGYREMAKQIHKSAIEFAETVKSFNELQLLADPEVNVVALKISKNSKLKNGAIYAFAHEMKTRGFIFNTMPGERAHFCITLRYASEEGINEKLRKAIQESLEAVHLLNSQLDEKNQTFPGSAGMYCALGNALEPKHTNLSFQKFIENCLLGIQGAREAIRAHYLALFDPYNKQSPYAKKAAAGG